MLSVTGMDLTSKRQVAMDLPEGISDLMGKFTMGDVIHISRLAKDEPEPSPREFAIELIERKIKPDEAFAKRLENYTDDHLAGILMSWFLRNHPDYDWNPPEDSVPLEYCRQALVDHITELNARMSETIAGRDELLKPMREIAASSVIGWQSPVISSLAAESFRPLAQVMDQYREENARMISQLAEIAGTQRLALPNLSQTSFAKEMAAMNSTQSHLLDVAAQISSPLSKLAEASSQSAIQMMDEVLRAAQEMLRMQAPDLTKQWREEWGTMRALYEQVTAIPEYSIAAQSSLGRIATGDLGGIIGIGEQARAILERDILGLSRSYSEYLQTFEVRPRDYLAFPSVVAEAPPRGFFNNARLVETISVEPELYEIEEESVDDLEELLALIDPELIRLLRGARKALASDNPDRVRHTITSFRELLTQVLHRLAPDDDVKNWSTSAKDLDKGRPTRRARLMYICRSINCPPFSEYVQKDVDIMLEVVELLQRGTHQVTIPYTEKQLLALKVTLENGIRYLIEISIS